MSGAVAHLTVANRILKKQPELVHNTAAFYLGSIAPDTIESKKNCSREEKKRVHLREGIPDIEWMRSDNMELFKSRTKRFIREHIPHSQGSQQDFIIGYLVHLLTDAWHHKIIRQSILQKANSIHIQESDESFFSMMANDQEAMDYYLLSSSEEIQDLFSCILNQGAQYALEGFVEKEYIRDSIDWWRNDYLVTIRKKSLNHLAEADILAFVDIAAQDILSEIKSLL